MTGRPEPQVVVHPSKEDMAATTAARLVTTLVTAQSEGGTASVVLTGGRNGNGVLAALAASPGRDAVEWSRLDLWWGDERYLPSGDPDRNDTQARAALLDSVPLDPARVHSMPVRTARTARTSSRPPPRTPRSWPMRPRPAWRRPGSTCCCSASGRTRTSPRSSPSRPPCGRPSGSRWVYEARPSRRPPGSP